MNITLAIKKGSRWAAVTVDEQRAQVTATSKLEGFSYCCVNGTGDNSIKRILSESIWTWPTLKALAENCRDAFTDEPTWKRAAEYDI